MLASSLLVAVVLGVGINAQKIVPRQTPDATAVPDASGKPTTPTITVTATVTATSLETSFVTAFVTVVNDVTLSVTETEIDVETEFITGTVTSSITELEIETQVVTQDVTQAFTLTKTQTITQDITLIKTQTITQDITLPAVTVDHTVFATKTVTATSPLSSLCPGGNEEVFEAGRGIFIILCGQTKKTFDLIPGGQSTDSVYSCAQLCDALTGAGVGCSAGLFEADTSTCFPQGVGEFTADAATGFDTAVLNSTMVASKMMKRSPRLF